jgi:hypothetical protein
VNLSLAIPTNPALSKAIKKSTDDAAIEARFELQTFVAKPQASEQAGQTKKAAKK